MSSTATDYDDVDQVKKDVQDQFARPSGDAEAKDAAREWLERHRKIRAVADSSRGYEDFALAYIQREQARHTASPDDHHYDGTREKPVCTCDPHNCPLKQGQLPRELSNADSVNEGIREFRTRQGHTGNPLVLSEAKRVYALIMAAAEEVYQEAQSILLHYDDGHRPPEEDIELDEQTQQALNSL